MMWLNGQFTSQMSTAMLIFTKLNHVRDVIRVSKANEGQWRFCESLKNYLPCFFLALTIADLIRIFTVQDARLLIQTCNLLEEYTTKYEKQTPLLHSACTK